jgi:hypothetical protein
MPYIPTEPVQSSNIEAIGYHRQTQTLRIAFKSREGPPRVYDYPMVPEREYQKLMEAESKGRFFNSRIKPMYAHRTPRPEELQPPDAELLVGGDVSIEQPEAGDIKDACSDHPDECPHEDEELVGHEGTEEDRDDLIDGVCRCCGVPLKITPEDAVDLCLACYRGKGGDTDELCTFDHPDCPHGADGRDCEEGCSCVPCHGTSIGTTVSAEGELGGESPVDSPPGQPAYPGPMEQPESD